MDEWTDTDCEESELDEWSDDDFEESELDEWSDDKFEEMLENLQSARKLSRQATILSVIALGINIIRIITIVIRSMA